MTDVCIHCRRVKGDHTSKMRCLFDPKTTFKSINFFEEQDVMLNVDTVLSIRKIKEPPLPWYKEPLLQFSLICFIVLGLLTSYVFWRANV